MRAHRTLAAVTVFLLLLSGAASAQGPEIDHTDPSSLRATLTCASRPGPTGAMNASGTNYNLTGTYSFGSQQGTLSVRRQQ